MSDISPEPEPASDNKPRLLIANDESFILSFLQERLKFKFHVETADNGLDAL
jgi:hypothetical protein